MQGGEIEKKFHGRHDEIGLSSYCLRRLAPKRQTPQESQIDEILRWRMKLHLKVHPPFYLWFSVHNTREPICTWFFTLETSKFIHRTMADNGNTGLTNLWKKSLNHRKTWHK
mmetsp:Transcript_18724/g.40732  ORF Transcript_18724/g.40732 Transcript_18724/m.40732 type:complete len:112 (-) Transcript_18724:32-367(-)